MKTNYCNSNIHIQNGENGVQPGLFIIENDIVYMVTITTNHRFNITNEGKLGEKYRYNTDGSIELCGENKEDNKLSVINTDNNFTTNQSEFNWDNDSEDPDLYNKGVTILWVCGRTKSIQNFIEKLSHKIGSKCDFSWSAGRAHIDCYKDACGRAIEAINDEEFMKQFIVPYSKETYNNETYFEVLK